MDGRQRRRSFSIRLVATAVLFVILGSLVTYALYVRERTRERTPDIRSRYQEDWVKAELAMLQSGRQSHVYFYCTFGTDALIARFRGMPEVSVLHFQSTDITADGMKIVRDFPNLQELVLYGPSDAGLEKLRDHDALKTLKLINAQLTDRGLAVFKSLPSLKALTLYREAHRETTLTAKAGDQLRELKQLEYLELSGGWASAEIVRSLQESLPNCEVTTKVSTDLFP